MPVGVDSLEEDWLANTALGTTLIVVITSSAPSSINDKWLIFPSNQEGSIGCSGFSPINKRTFPSVKIACSNSSV